MGHPGVPIWSTLLALASLEEVSGKIFLQAAVRAYDAYCHIGRVINPKAYLERGFDATGTCGAIAASVAAGTIMGLNEEELANSISIAASLCGGLNQYAIDGGSPKYLCAGWAAQLGVQSAKLAKSGADGPHSVFEGKKGFCQGFAISYDKQALEDIAVRWDILDVYLKRFACVRRLHASLDMVESIVEEHNLTPNKIDKINIAGSHFIAESAIYNPKDIVLAQTSMPYAIAVLLKYGEVTQELIDGNLRNADILALSQKVRIKEDESFNDLLKQDKGLWGAASVEVTTVAGESSKRSLKYALGERENPMPPEILKNKFIKLACKNIDERAANDLFDTMSNLSRIDDMKEIVSTFVY
ncbi:hypothetical protein FACS1894204_00410 [Synergistales bacterium]|nr:hypothetical protein FACS1894204_00410 [Synergistales bacterium]